MQGCRRCWPWLSRWISRRMSSRTAHGAPYGIHPFSYTTPRCLLAMMMAVDMGLMQMNAFMDRVCLAASVLGIGSAVRLPWGSLC